MSRSAIEISDAGEEFREPVRKSLDELATRRIIPRIFEKDWTVWKDDPAEIQNRLGWLTSPRRMEERLPETRAFARAARRRGLARALLLGMGGSSLAPLVMASVFPKARGYLELDVLDSTDPAAVLRRRRKLSPAKTQFLVSSKSGTTVETDSFFKYFWSWTEERLGREEAGKRFAAITDPGTPLEAEARRLGFAAVFRGDPEIGGRFSALSAFGLAPAALLGIRAKDLLRRAAESADRCRNQDLEANPGAYLGAVLGTLAHKERDKLTLVLSSRLRSFGLWLEQLIAESTGKEGKGILPVEGERLGGPEVYGRDRYFVVISEKGERIPRASLERLKDAGFPVVSMTVPGVDDLGGLFFVWELAVAVAGHLLNVNPFDQPDVDSAKKRTQEFLRYYRDKGALPEEAPPYLQDGIEVHTDIEAATLEESVRTFLAEAEPGDYVALQAFLEDRRETAAALQRIRLRLRDRTRLATTLGYGPRFLHSTGQLHKGDRGNGLFIQITAADSRDAPIPDGVDGRGSRLTFGILKAAQARGDFAALKDAGRRVIRFHLRGDPAAGLRTIEALLE